MKRAEVSPCDGDTSRVSNKSKRVSTTAPPGFLEPQPLFGQALAAFSSGSLAPRTRARTLDPLSRSFEPGCVRVAADKGAAPGVVAAAAVAAEGAAAPGAAASALHEAHTEIDLMHAFDVCACSDLAESVMAQLFLLE